VSRAEELAALMPEGLRADPAAADFLVRFWTGWAELFEPFLDLKRERLKRLLDPDLAPDDTVSHLAAIVGMGPDLDAAYDESPAALRKLIRRAFALWKSKGTRPSWRSVVAALTGRRALILDWFYYRTIEGTSGIVHTIPVPGGAGAPWYSVPDYVSDLWLMDPLGVVDVPQLARWLDVVRPAGERINVRTALWVDDLIDPEVIYDAGGAGTVTHDADAYTITLTDTRKLSVDAGGDELTWADYHVGIRMAVTGLCTIDAYRQGDTDTYRVSINETAQTVKLYRMDPAATLLATVAVFIGPGIPYRWSVDLYPVTGGVEIQIHRESTLLITHTDTTGSQKTAGGIAFGGLSAGAVAVMSQGLAWQHGVATTRVGPTP